MANLACDVRFTELSKHSGCRGTSAACSFAPLEEARGRLVDKDFVIRLLDTFLLVEVVPKITYVEHTLFRLIRSFFEKEHSGLLLDKNRMGWRVSYHVILLLYPVA